MFLNYKQGKQCFPLINLTFICVTSLISLGGCEPSDVAIDYPRIVLEPHFTINNESSHKKTIELTTVFIDSNGILNTEWTQSLQLNPGKKDELETLIAWSSNEKKIISFLLIINDKHYTGWAADAVPGDITRVEYGLGYVVIDTDKIFPPLLMSTLEPEIRKDGSRKNIAFYTVTITEERVKLILDKQIDGSEPSI
jgi:hypothetical protein